MRIDFKTTTALPTLLAAIACFGSLDANAVADTPGPAGGSVAPSPTPASPTSGKTKIHTTGIATWFGPGFYGQKTACGQTLTPSVIGVANRTLPCGTLVKVSYKGHSLTVPVLDRGPYSQIGADWDLTAGAAASLDIAETVRIGTRLIGSAPNIPTLGLPAGAPSEAALAGGAIAG